DGAASVIVNWMAGVGLPVEVDEDEALSEGLVVGRAVDVALIDAPDAPSGEFHVVPHAPSAMMDPTAAIKAMDRRARLQAPVSDVPWSPNIRQR
ncbi:MAG TPA: hypothetical protein PLA46_11550, partial [Phycicoccus sp.]|nr:hypothetical protein [Phycicoccus sp.]